MICNLSFLTNLTWEVLYDLQSQFSPFEALYDYPHPQVIDYVTGTTRVRAVDLLLKDRQQLLALLKQNLRAAQERMKWYVDKKNGRDIL